MYCRKEAPYLVQIHQKYKDQGVVFISLTAEDAAALADIEDFVNETGITWPVGYGAVDTLAALRADYIPALWVVDQSGMIVWSSEVDGDLEAAIARALANPPPAGRR